MFFGNRSRPEDRRALHDSRVAKDPRMVAEKTRTVHACVAMPPKRVEFIALEATEEVSALLKFEGKVADFVKKSVCRGGRVRSGRFSDDGR